MLATAMNGARPPIGWIFVLVALGGCASKSKAAQDTATPTATALPVEDGIDTRARELEDYEAQLRALGLTTEGEKLEDGAGGEDEAKPSEPATAKTAADRCGRICDLADAICGLETSVCDLASEHPDDARYADVCARAKADCELASSACKECDGG